MPGDVVIRTIVRYMRVWIGEKVGQPADRHMLNHGPRYTLVSLCMSTRRTYHILSWRLMAGSLRRVTPTARYLHRGIYQSSDIL